MTSIELHIPTGNDTIKVIVDVFTPLDPTKTPRIHGAPIPPGYARVIVDKVSKGYEDLALDIPGGIDTMVQALHHYPRGVYSTASRH
jgi:hypothetical protein